MFINITSKKQQKGSWELKRRISSLTMLVRARVCRVPVGLADRRQSLKADAIQSTMGDFGRWQLGIVLAIGLSGLPGAWFKIGIVFLAPPVDYWCTSPTPGPGISETQK